MESATPWFAVALLLRPQGRRGELLADPLTDQTDLLNPGREIWLAKAGTNLPVNEPPRTLEEAWQPTGRNSGRWVLKLSGSESINDAESLAGYELLIPASELPALDADTYFVRDLIGCQLYDGQTLVGEIIGIEYLVGSDGKRQEDAAPFLVVQATSATISPAPGSEALADDNAESEEAEEDSPDGEPDDDDSDDEQLVPFLRSWLESVDLAGRKIVMHLPEGLLEEFE